MSSRLISASLIGRSGSSTFTVGAARYVFFTPNSNWGKLTGTTTGGFGTLSDAVYGGGIGVVNSDLQFTTAWGVNAAYEHFWSPRWKTSAYGGYAAVRYDDTANSELCGFGTIGAAVAAAVNCNFNWSTYWVGSRTQWNLDSSTYLALDVLYQKLNSADFGIVGALPHTAFSAIGATVARESPDNGSARFRVHRDFYP